MIWELLRKYGDILTRTNQTPPLDNYGLFWGCVAMSEVLEDTLLSFTGYQCHQCSCIEKVAVYGRRQESSWC